MPRTSPLDLALVLAGFVIWGAALNTLYGIQGLGCELGWNASSLGPVSLQRAALIVAWLAFLGVHAVLLGWLWQRLPGPAGHDRLGRFVHTTGVLTAAAGLAATLVTGAPVAFLTPCTP